MDNGSRMTRVCHVRFCERLKVKLLGPTHLKGNRLQIRLAGAYFTAFLVNRMTIDLQNRQNLPSPSQIFATIL